MVIMSDVTAKRYTTSVVRVKDAPPGAVDNLPSDDGTSSLSTGQKQKLLELCKRFVKILREQRFV